MRRFFFWAKADTQGLLRNIVLRKGILAFFVFFSASSFALGPHELLLLVNRSSPDSLAVANEYIALRGIPLSNVVYLDLPGKPSNPPVEISTEQFNQAIWEPARAALQDRGLSEQVLAWVFSAGFPVRVGTDPPMSIHGLVFTRNQPPESKRISEGRYVSPLFRGPSGPESPAGPSLSLETLNAALKNRMPCVSMTLAHTKPRGLSQAKALDVLGRSAEADGTQPEGTVYFVVSDDVRSRAREWQYESAAAELETLGVRSVQTERFPSGANDVVGLLMGASNPKPERVGTYLPGAMAEHLTSWAATFDRPHQTKATDWLRAGACGSAGTVTEPLSAWTKFPAARFFVHYARGCTLLESFVQSVASPVQLLLLGDPLTAPWKPSLKLTLQEDDAAPSGSRSFRAILDPAQPAEYLFFLNGSRVSPLLRAPRIRLPADLSGHHTLRVVAYTPGLVRHQAYAEIERDWPGINHSLHVEQLEPDNRLTLSTSIRLRITVEGDFSRIRLLAQGRTVQTLSGEPATEVTIDPTQVGPGPVVFQAVAESGEHAALRSRPLRVTIFQDQSEGSIENPEEPSP